MDAFEHVVATILFQSGYWVTQGFKVDLTPTEKAAIGKKTTPRWELDLVAYRGGDKHLLVIECKSYLDSTGVQAKEVIATDAHKSRYKLFIDPTLRSIVFNRLSIQMSEMGLIPQGLTAQLALAVGKYRNQNDRIAIENHFQQNSWMLFSPDYIAQRLREISNQSYFDSVAHIVAKIIIRNNAELRS